MKQNYYSVLPASVRYSKELTLLEKILYSEITCLTNYKGYCWATNNYFGELYGRSKGTISKAINNLVRLNYIEVKIVREGKYESRVMKVKETGVVESIYPRNEKSLGGVVKNKKDNNNSNINNKKDVLFEKFWDAYNYKKSRKLCYTKFMSLSYEVCEKCVSAAKIYSDSITNKKYKKHPSTWLNQGCWDDEVDDKNKDGFTGGKFDNFVF